jgi:hypothetical protein
MSRIEQQQACHVARKTRRVVPRVESAERMANKHVRWRNSSYEQKLAEFIGNLPRLAGTPDPVAPSCTSAVVENAGGEPRSAFVDVEVIQTHGTSAREEDHCWRSGA